MQKKIQFFIAGAAKSGTTSLHDYLRQHSAIYLPREKDIGCFLGEPHGLKVEEFMHYYSGGPSGALVGGSEVNLMYFPDAAPRIASYNPSARLIIILRNRIDRAHSSYWYNYWRGIEGCKTFEIALDKEPERLNGTFQERASLTYLAHGHYYEQITRLLECFRSDDVFVCLTDDLTADPTGLLEVDWYRRKNVSSRPRFRWMQALVGAKSSRVKDLFHTALPLTVRRIVRYALLQPIQKLGVIETRYPPMADTTRSRLRDYYRQKNEKLARLVNRDLDHWT